MNFGEIEFAKEQLENSNWDLSVAMANHETRHSFQVNIFICILSVSFVTHLCLLTLTPTPRSFSKIAEKTQHYSVEVTK